MSGTAVLAMAYGTPAGPDEIEAYYTHIRRGRPPTPELLEDLSRRYQAIGGQSPLLQITRDQVDALRDALAAAGHGDVPVVLGMKHASPFIEDAVAELACIHSRSLRRKTDRDKPDPGQKSSIEALRQLPAIDPWRSDLFEGGIGAATNRDVGRFDKTKRGIQDRLLQTAQIGRRIVPGETRGIEPVAPLPALHRDNREWRSELLLPIEIPCQFSQAHTVTHRNGCNIHITFAAWIRDWPLNK